MIQPDSSTPNRGAIIRLFITLLQYSGPFLLIFLASYVLEVYQDRLAVRVIKWVFYGAAAVSFTSRFYFRRYALKRWGGVLDRPTLSLLARTHVASAGFLLSEVALVMMVIGFGIAGSAILFGGGWLSLGLVLMTIGWSLSSRLSTPPLVVFFATSRDESQRLADRLARGLSPSRVVHLLRLASSEPADQDIGGITHRTLDGTKWQQSAESLMQVSRVIVLDCRDSTPPVVYEARVILTSDYRRKTIFVGDEGGRCRVFQQVVSDGGISRTTEVYVLPESMVLPAVRRIAESPPGTPGSELFLVPLKTVGAAV